MLSCEVSTMGKFQIDATKFYWINEEADDPEDLCLHGHVVVSIGDLKLEDDCTVSATALYLLKSLTEDHMAGGGDSAACLCKKLKYPIDKWRILLYYNRAVTETARSEQAHGEVA